MTGLAANLPPIGRIAAASLLAFIVAAWAVQHQYLGVTHDAILYAMQAIAVGDLAHLQDDLYLRYGSQDAYTIFSPIYRAAMASLGFEHASMAMVLVGQALWIGGAVWLLWRLFKTDLRMMLIAGVFIAAYEPHYGVTGALVFAEGFATPRLWSEALSLFVLGFVADRRWAAAGVTFLLAFSLHPIMATVSGGFIYFYLAMLDRRWLWLALPGGLGAAALAVSGAGPFADALTRFDSAWLEVVQRRSPHLFLEVWPRKTWLYFIGEILILIAAARLAEGPLRRFFLVGVIAFVLGIVATGLGADLAQNVFIAKAQPWRIFWLSHVFGLIALAFLFLRIGPASGGWPISARLAVVALTLSHLATEFAPPARNASVLAAAATLLIMLIAFRDSVPARIARAVLAILGVLALVYAAAFVAIYIERLAAFEADGFGPTVGAANWRRSLIPFAAVIAAIFVGVARGKWAGALTAPVGAALAIWGVAFWDARPDWRAYIEANFGTLGDGAIQSAKDDIVLWQGGNPAVPVWFGLNRKTYLSWPQGAGVVFNRGTAMEYDRRSPLVGPIDDSATGFSFSRRLKGAPSPTPADFRRICGEPDAPSVFVLIIPVDGVAGRRWRADVADFRLFSTDPNSDVGDWATRDFREIRDYWIYRCEDFDG